MNLSLAPRKYPKTRKGEYSYLYLIRVDKNLGFIPEFLSNHKIFGTYIENWILFYDPLIINLMVIDGAS